MAMANGIIVKTSKSNALWPTEYWKTLFDSVFIHGSKNNPYEKHPDLQGFLSEKIHHDDRYYLQLDSDLQNQDDSKLKFINIVRVSPGKETILITTFNEINTDDWHVIKFPYFGTIGDSKYELQTKKNGQEIETAYYDTLIENSESKNLSLSFQLNEGRKDRDVDNLADALMPFFNRKIRGIENLFLMKEDRIKENYEILRFSFDEVLKE